MGVHIIDIPDCPRCGHEMEQRMKYKDDSGNKASPFGIPIRWWECPNCGERMDKDADGS